MTVDGTRNQYRVKALGDFKKLIVLTALYLWQKNYFSSKPALTTSVIEFQDSDAA